MKAIAVFLLSIMMGAFFGCKSSVFLSVKVFEPHCGGAALTSTESFDVNRPLNDTIMIVGEVDTLLVALNSLGEAKIRIHEGAYDWFQFSKSYSSEYTYASMMNVDKKLYEFLGMDCVDVWRNTPDGSFKYEFGKSKIDLLLRSNCFTRLVPCLKYIGPSVQ